MKTIYIYPSPENVNKVLFKDKAENCFLFKEEIVECPNDISLISNIPIQTKLIFYLYTYINEY